MENLKEAIEKVNKAKEILKSLVYEREELIDGMAAATISHDGVAVLGPKGTTKTLVGRLWAHLIDKDEVFEVLEQPGLSPDNEFGPIDIKEYTTTGRQVRNTENMMPSKKFIIIDEADKASDANRFGQFPIIHPEERKFYNMSAGVQAARAKFVYMTMNVRDTREELEPYFDRIALTYKVDYIRDAHARSQFLWSIWSNSAAKFVPSPDQIIGWDTIEMLHDALSRVRADDDVIKALERIDEGLRAESISYSDRKLSWVPRLARAKALLDGRLETQQEDLIIAKDMLWDRYEDKQKVEEIIMRSIDSIVIEARILYNSALEIVSNFEQESLALRGQEDQTNKVRELVFDANASLVSIVKNMESKLNEAKNASPAEKQKVNEWINDIKERNKRMMSGVLAIEF